MKKKTYLAACLLTLAVAAGGCGSGGSSGNMEDASDPAAIPKFVEPLVIPPVMPRAGVESGEDYYEIAVRQFDQQVLPSGFPKTTVWGYGRAGFPSTFNYPGFTVEAKTDVPVRVKWINELVDDSGNYLPHLLPVDQTLHWANPLDTGRLEEPYTGPVPIVTHLHGAHVDADSDGHPLAWMLPDAANLPAGASKLGPHFTEMPGAPHEDGAAYYRYVNTQPATTLWYHDHAMGMTRLNVYAGMAGFWLLRDPGNEPADLPGPAPRLNDPAGMDYYEIPLAIQDRSFNKDGSFFYPSSRVFFDGYEGPYLPEEESVVPPIWNPEFFGDTIVVNGKTWPYLNVEPRKYRFRILNGCNSRFLVLSFDQAGGDAGLDFKIIANEGGYYPDSPVIKRNIVMSPAERFDVIVDFSTLSPGDEVTMLNLAPDEPYKGWGDPDNGPPADPDTTGQIMKFRVVPLKNADTSVFPETLPSYPALDPGSAVAVRDLTLNEAMLVDENGEYPTEAALGTLVDGHQGFMDPVSETPIVGTTEIWRIINLTGDAHPIHLHLTRFNVLGRTPVDAEELAEDEESYLMDEAPLPLLENYLTGDMVAPYEWEKGFKETVTAPPGMVTTVIANFDLLGDYVWHCHILEHEDNEMMRPFTVISAP